MEDKNFITVKEMYEQDLCIDDGAERLFDDVNEFIEDMLYSQCNKITQDDKESLLEQVSAVPVYKKKYFNIPKGFLMEHIEDYMRDNWDCEDPEAYINDREIIEQAEEEFNSKQRYFYHRHNEIVAYVDLTTEMKEMLEDVEV